MIEIIVDAADSMQRVDKYLIRQLPGAGKSLIYKQIRKKNITLNGSKMSGQEKLAKGDTIQLYFADETYEKFREPLYNELNEKTLALCDKAYETLTGIRVVYEDENILVLNKPMGILSQQAIENDMSLNEWAIGYLHNNGTVDARSLAHFKPSVLNRLDRNTSGMVIVGKTLLGSNTCSELIRNRKIEKYYLTMVMGKLEGSRTLFGYHVKDGSNMMQMRIISKRGVSASHFFTGLLNSKLNSLLMKLADIDEDELLNEENEDKFIYALSLARALKVTVKGTKSFEHAQVCIGGVDVSEVDNKLRSKIVPGLFIVGEMLDVDGRCGGYNLQWAWASGYIAGYAAGLEVNND